MTEIKYKLVDGEPVCLGDECPSFGKKETGVSFIHYRNCKITGLNFNEIDLPHDGYKDVMEGHPCIPGLRQQRDDRERERDEARAELQPAISERNELRGLIEVYMTDLVEARADIHDLLYTLDSAIPKDAHPWMHSKYQHYGSKYALPNLHPAPATEGGEE